LKSEHEKFEFENCKARLWFVGRNGAGRSGM
jgi:hypothetical protein